MSAGVEHRWRVLAWLTATAVLGLSLAPGTTMPPAPMADLDKLVHVVMYAVLTALFIRAYPTAGLIVPGIAVFAYGAALEVVQHVATERHGSWADAAANAVGISIILCDRWRVAGRAARDSP